MESEVFYYLKNKLTLSGVLASISKTITNFFRFDLAGNPVPNSPSSPIVIQRDLDPNYEVVRDPVTNNVIPFSQLIPSIAFDISNVFNIFGQNPSANTRPTVSQETLNPIDAFVQIALYDTKDKLVSLEIIPCSGAVKAQWQILNRNKSIAEDGYLVISILNDESTPVFFDDLKVKINRKGGLQILQENHYEAFGMSLQGLDYVLTKTENKFLFNGGTERELNTHLDETAFRLYDPQLGIFRQVDPLADESPEWSPTRFGFDNPILFNDPDGLWEQTGNGWRTSDKTEIADFVKAWKNAGTNAKVFDAKKGNENNELFRVVGDSRIASVFYGEERTENNNDKKFSVHSTAHPDDMDSKMEALPMLGSIYQSKNEFAQGNYGTGVMYAGLAGSDVIGSGLKVAGVAIATTGVKRFIQAISSIKKVNKSKAAGASANTSIHTLKAIEDGLTAKMSKPLPTGASLRFWRNMGLVKDGNLTFRDFIFKYPTFTTSDRAKYLGRITINSMMNQGMGLIGIGVGTTTGSFIYDHYEDGEDK